MKRRNFIRTAGASLLSVPLSLNGLKLAASPYMSATSAMELNDQILVLVYLSGGNDGLNTVIPLDQYGNLSSHRTNVLIPEAQVLNMTPETGLHPAMTGMHNMFNDGQLSVIQGVGYPNFNRSHFRAKDIYNSGSGASEVLTSGFMGRYLETEVFDYPNDYPNGQHPDPFALTIGSLVSKTCQGFASNFSLAITDPFNLNPLATGIGGDPPAGFYGDRLSYLRTTISQTNQYATVIQDAANLGSNQVTYPDTNLANQLKTVANLISGGLQTKVYVVSQGGYDTHGAQVDNSNHGLGTHANKLQELSDAIAAFQNDMNAQSMDDRVMGVVYTEFGRRIISNGGRGTDHGDAGPMFLFGSEIVPGIFGSNPTIPDTVSNSQGVPIQYDFRDVYRTVLDSWMCSPESNIQNDILYGAFTSLDNVGGPCGVALLPIELLSFEAQAFESHIGLMWEIGEAETLDGFWLQRSKNGIEFEDYVYLEGYSNVKAYQFKDRDVQRGKMYHYRLKQVETDGNTSFSLIRSAMIQDGAREWLTVYPNPTAREINIQTSEDRIYDDAQLVICDRTGKPVFEQSWTGGSLRVLVGHLPEGMYSAHIYTQTQTLVKKFLKLNQ